ncbi:hypothetical protein BDW62DRAFT_177307 [Aspergillus aurantiobrunneus]
MPSCSSGKRSSSPDPWVSPGTIVTDTVHRRPGWTSETVETLRGRRRSRDLESLCFHSFYLSSSPLLLTDRNFSFQILPNIHRQIPLTEGADVFLACMRSYLGPTTRSRPAEWKFLSCACVRDRKPVKILLPSRLLASSLVAVHGKVTQLNLFQRADHANFTVLHRGFA